jgi:hypothetical protein
MSKRRFITFNSSKKITKKDIIELFEPYIKEKYKIKQLNFKARFSSDIFREISYTYEDYYNNSLVASSGNTFSIGYYNKKFYFCTEDENEVDNCQDLDNNVVSWLETYGKNTIFYRTAIHYQMNTKLIYMTKATNMTKMTRITKNS